MPPARSRRTCFIGAGLGTVRFWHGELRTRWAREWVRLQTDGEGVLAMSDGEDGGRARHPHASTPRTAGSIRAAC